MPEKTVQKEPSKKPVPSKKAKPQQEVVVQIPLLDLHPFPDHPFQVREDQNNFGTTTVLTIPHDGGGGYHGGTESPQPHALGGADEHAESAGGGSAVAGISLYLILGIDEAGILQASKQSRLYLIYFPVFLTAGIPMAIGRIVF